MSFRSKRDPADVCAGCPELKRTHDGRCPYGLHKHKSCAKFMACIATNALDNDDCIKMIPLESLVMALRVHGYAGELRKTGIVTI